MLCTFKRSLAVKILMPRLFNFIACLAFAAGYVAAMWPEEWIIGNTCQQVAKVNFDSCNSQDGECLCDNTNYASSVAQCIQSSLNTTLAIDTAWDFVFMINCRKSAEASDELFKTATNYLNTTELTFLTPEFNRSEIFTGPLVFDHNSLKSVHTSIYVNLRNKDVSVIEGSVLVAIFVVAAVLASLSNFLTFIAFKFASKRQVMARPSGMTRFFQKRLLIPACFGVNHINRVYIFGSIPIFIPTRMESLIIAIYSIAALIFLCVGYVTMPFNPLWPTHYSATVLNLSNKAGIIATVQIPLLTLFALRNNFLIWATGWSFSTFNAYHRAIGRVTFILIVVHAIGKNLMMLTFHVPLAKILYPEKLYRLGVTALAAMSLMIIFSMVRAKIYEIFLAVHIAGAVIAFFTALYHLNGLGYKQAVYVSLAIWGADVLIRLGRLLFINFAVFLDPASGSGRMTSARVSMLESDVINVRITTPINWAVTPGQYVFIHFTKFSFFQSHPFSVVGASDDGESFQLMCKIRSGITSKIQKHLKSEQRSGKYSEITPVLIEGPYGVHCPVERYDTVLLVAGGIGITGMIPYAEFLVNTVSKQQHVILIWTVGMAEEFSWVKDRLQKLVKTGKFELCLFSTRPSKKIEDPLHSIVYDNKETQTEFHLRRISTNDSMRKEEPHFEYTDDSSEDMVIPNMGRETHFKERKRNSLYNHVKSFSQGSSRFQVDPTHRSENVDGHEMVAWPETIQPANHDNRRSHNRTSSSDYYNSRLNVGPYHESQQFKDSQSRFSFLKRPQTSVVVSQLESYDWADLIQEGRPNLLEITSELFLKATGSVAVVGCGPAMMMDTLRRVVVLNFDLVTNGRLDYFEEAYSW